MPAASSEEGGKKKKKRKDINELKKEVDLVKKSSFCMHVQNMKIIPTAMH